MTRLDEAVHLATVLALELDALDGGMADAKTISRCALELSGHAHQLDILNKRDCNVGLDERGQKKREAIQAEVSEICRLLGIPVRFSNDPRANAIVLDLPSGRTNRAPFDKGWGI